MEKDAKDNLISKKRKHNESAVKYEHVKKNKSKAISDGNQNKEIKSGNLSSETYEQYPILRNEDLIKRFQTVPLTNNQKGRIRQVLRDNLKGTADSILPEVIHNKIQTILKSSPDLTDSDLRKIRILYNMLMTKILTANPSKKKSKTSKTKEIKVNTGQKEKVLDSQNDKETVKQTKPVQKIKGPKRYVVFVGNLPREANKEMIMNHFSEISDFIKHVRIPKQKDEQKSCIAYLELANEPSFELALSKHHSMLGNKRINVLYTTQKRGKISKTDAKSKSAKMIALQKSGKLIGSIPLKKKRSHRRKIQKAALAKQTAEPA